MGRGDPRTGCFGIRELISMIKPTTSRSGDERFLPKHGGQSLTGSKVIHSFRQGMRDNIMNSDELEDGFRRLAALLTKQSNRSFRRYDLKRVDGRLMLVRNEIDLAFELAISEVYGIELEPDEKDGTFLDLRDHCPGSPDLKSKSIGEPAIDGRLIC
jgi:hypothetical protein